MLKKVFQNTPLLQIKQKLLFKYQKWPGIKLNNCEKVVLNPKISFFKTRNFYLIISEKAYRKFNWYIKTFYD